MYYGQVTMSYTCLAEYSTAAEHVHGNLGITSHPTPTAFQIKFFRSSCLAHFCQIVRKRALHFQCGTALHYQSTKGVYNWTALPCKSSRHLVTALLSTAADTNN